jgi:hypothetical protein
MRRIERLTVTMMAEDEDEEMIKRLERGQWKIASCRPSFLRHHWQAQTREKKR